MSEAGPPIWGFTEREKEILRLLNGGHDAKSIARTLQLSVHTVNERLRSARRKARVMSSREAARLLAGQEEPGHKNLVYDAGRVEVVGGGRPDGDLPVGRAAACRQPRTGGWTGAVMISLAVIGAAALIARSNADATHQPSPQPHVVATAPAPGATVGAGPLLLSVTFDRPMRPGNYSFVQIDPRTYPQCGDNHPRQSPDGRTFTLRCMVQPHHVYELWFNMEPYMNFKGMDGVPAVPFQLKFRAR